MIIFVFSCVYEAASMVVFDISLDRCIQYSLVWSAGSLDFPDLACYSGRNHFLSQIVVP